MLKMTRYLIFLSVFSIPFYHLFSILGIRITTTEILFSMAFGVWVIEQLFSENKIERSPLFFPIVLFLGACILSSFGAYNKLIAVRETVQFLWLFGIYFIILSFAKDGKCINSILLVCILAGLISSVVGLYKCIYNTTIHDLFLYRYVVSTTFEDQPNAFGSYLIAVIPFLIVFIIIENRKIWTYTMLFLVLVLLFTLLLTFSRSNWIGLIFGFSIIIILSKQLLNRYLQLFVILAIFFICMLLFYANFSYLSNVNTNASLALNTTIDFIKSVVIRYDSPRLSLAKSAFDMTIDHPLIGVGPGNYSLLLPKELQYIETPHNMFLQISAESGLVGLSAFLWLLYAYYKTSLKLVHTALSDKEKVIRAGIIGSATAVLASGLFGWPFSHGVQEILILSMALSTAPWGTEDKPTDVYR